MINTAIYQRLKSSSTLQSLLGDEIWPQVCRSGAATYLVYIASEIEPDRSEALDTLHRQCFVQIDAYSADYDACQEIGMEVRRLFDGFSGQGHDSPLQQIDRFLFIAQRENYEDDTQLHRVSIDFNCWFN